MKLLLPRYKVLFILPLLLIVAAILLTYFYLPQVLQVYNVYWLFAIVAFIIIFTPLGNRRLSENNSANDSTNDSDFHRKKFSSWIFQLLAFEISLMAIFFGLSILVGQPKLVSDSFSHFTIQQGLFPWTTIALTACAFGLMSYRHHQDAYFSTILHPLFPTKAEGTLKIIIDSLPRIATLFAISSTFAFYTLLIVHLFLPDEIESLSNINFISTTFYFLLLILTANKFVKRKIYLFTTYIRWPMFFRICSVFVILIILVTALSLFLGGIIVNTAPMPSGIQAFLRHGWLSNWNLFAFFWWLAWTPVMGIFIAKLSRGYSLRSIILGTCILPLALGLLAHAGHFSIEKIPTGLGIIIALGGFLLFFAIISPDHCFNSVMQAYLPKDDRIKYRATDRFLSTLLQFAAIMIFLYLAAGVVLLGLLFFAFMLLLSVLLLLLPLRLLLSLIFPSF